MLKYMSITKDTNRAKKFFENFLAYTTTPFGLNELIKKDTTAYNLVDVRTKEDYKNGHIPTAIHIPSDKLTQNLDLLDNTKPTIVYCYEQHCSLAKTCCLVFLENYFPSIELEGGFKSWTDHKYKIEK